MSVYTSITIGASSIGERRTEIFFYLGEGRWGVLGVKTPLLRPYLSRHKCIGRTLNNVSGFL